MYKIMTETRKQIIEIIEPYMDKSLSEGCLFLKNTVYPKTWKPKQDIFSVLSVISEEVGVSGIYFAVDWYKDEAPNVYYLDREEFEDNCFEIIWHYDITAVLKYIESKTIVSSFYLWSITFSFTLWEKMSPWDLLCWDKVIPNKPLHLYTEQEEKDLLDLLLKLKK